MPDETSLRPAHAVFHRGETRLRLTNALLLPAPYIARREQETGVFIDVDGEVLMWEGLFEQPDTYKTDMLDSLGKIGNTVLRRSNWAITYVTVVLGMNTSCNRGIWRFRLRSPTAFLNRFSGQFSAFHMLVPRDRNDDAFFDRWLNLSLPKRTALYLGCVHRGDDAGNAVKLDKPPNGYHRAGAAESQGRGCTGRTGGITGAGSTPA